MAYGLAALLVILERPWYLRLGDSKKTIAK
jgi:hypothetical protein